MLCYTLRDTVVAQTVIVPFFLCRSLEKLAFFLLFFHLFSPLPLLFPFTFLCTMAGQTAKRASRIFQDRASKFIKVQTGPKWKRELVPDHKFDFIDVDEFRQHSCYNYFRYKPGSPLSTIYHILTLQPTRYLVLYILIIISTASYFADLWSAGILLIYNASIFAIF